MMVKLSDEELIEVLRDRFDTNRRAINDLRELTAKLEATNRRLQDSEALRSHFLSNIRNEINNPLTAIMGIAYHLMTSNSRPDQVAANARFIYDEAFELHFQLENVFTAAGLEAGQESPVSEQVNVAAILNDVLERLDHRRSQKQIEIRRRFCEDMPFVADPRFMKIIVTNLIANALEFSPLQGTVTINLVSDDSALRISVRDDGPGIDSAHHVTVFDRFRQLDWGSCKAHRGLGLGLSICRALAQLSGGEILLESSRNSGSTFTLCLSKQGPGILHQSEEEPFSFFDTVERF